MRISKEVNAKKWNISGGHGKIDRKSRKSTSKKLISSTEGVQFFSGKAHFILETTKFSNTNNFWFGGHLFGLDLFYRGGLLLIPGKVILPEIFLFCTFPQFNFFVI